jgi:abhydrolase domain-containing protein 17
MMDLAWIVGACMASMDPVFNFSLTKRRSVVLFFCRALACLDIFPNIDRIKKVKCPVMVIHGKLDEEVSLSHGKSLHEAVPEEYKRDPWWVPDRGHNDITEGPGKLAAYIEKLRSFLTTLHV